MPGVGSIQTSEVTAAISRAASRTGVDFNFLVAEARIESGLDPQAQARTSSARGLYQFVDSTWLRTVDKHGAKHGMAWAGDAVANGRVIDPSLRAEVMALRDDPDASALMAAELALDNREGLRTTLGHEPDNSELYIAHFLGLGGAQEFLTALASQPDQLAALVNPAAARANRGIFYEGGRMRTVAEVMTVIQGKLANASRVQALGAGQSGGTSEFMQMRAQFQQTPAAASELPTAPRTISMAETLRSTFGDDTMLDDRADARVAAAYGKFRSFAL